MVTEKKMSSVSPSVTVHTSHLFDSRSKKYLVDHSLTFSPETGLITALFPRTQHLPQKVQSPDIDLRGLYVFPGFVDAHTHIFLHSYSETPDINQMRDESPVERIIRATNHLRSALLAGYTTYRDLGTESLGDADIHVRNAVNRGITPGPRLYVASEALASSGGYEIRVENTSSALRVPRISDPCDGVYGVRAGVRRRIGAGADIVKFYADYRKRKLRFPSQAWPGAEPIAFPPQTRNPSLPLFRQDEMDEIVKEARTSRCPVASHAISPEGAMMASRAGVTSVEHGWDPDAREEHSGDLVKAFKDNETIYVPTLAVYDSLGQPMEGFLKHVYNAWKTGVKLACGGDTGAFPHGDNVKEAELMIKAGVPTEDVLQALTLHGWEACGGDWCGRRFGWLGSGYAADLTALKGNPLEDTEALREVDLVMKDGRVWKNEGSPVGMI
ncbi:MAG: hypothetical protein Q9227_008500 [Pyrenula ochraceoflavens]